MRIKYFTLFLIYCLLQSFSISGQVQEINESFNKINNILHEYEILTPEEEANAISKENRCFVAKNMTTSYQYPHFIISYNIVYAPGVTDAANYKPGKRIVRIPITNTSFSIEYAIFNNEQLNFKSEYGIEITTGRRKDLLDKWHLSMSPIVCKQLQREFTQFKFLVNKYDYKGVLGGTYGSVNRGQQAHKTVIKLNKDNSGVYTLSCKLNELPLNFIFDTGASTVSISQSEAVFMLKNGYLKSSDIIGSERFMTASGDIMVGAKIIIRKIEIGGLVLKNVEASIVPNNNAPLLLGQSVLNRLGRIEINFDASTLTIIH